MSAVRLLPRAHPGGLVRVLVIGQAAALRGLPDLHTTGHVAGRQLETLERRAASGRAMTAPTVGEASTAITCLCGHAEWWHDAIATRYCRATAVSHLARSCICRPDPGDLDHSPTTAS
jgi:hypothetical protein